MELAAENIPLYRYPGTKFFEPNQNNIFFGREQETSELVHAIKAHDVFVIFADSGIGKTSLLNAGIVPALEKEGFEAISFRFQDASLSPLKSIAKKLSAYCNQPALFEQEEIRLWRLFKCCQFQNKTPLLILDQYEEFFNHPRQERENCITELADLVNDYLPGYVKDEMRLKFKDKDPTAIDLTYYAPLRVKMLFLIRADKLRFLDDLSAKIPLILRNRFHLKPLNVVQAAQAIVRPAYLLQNGFVSPTFSYQPAALDAICDYLKNDEDEVESFQLQVLCRELEKKIIDRFQQDANAVLTITADELGGEEGMDNITKNYYKNQINCIADEAQRKQAVELIEEKLIVGDRRISLPEVLLLSQGYSKDLLDYLLNTTRLIRIDNERYVEISHDRLLSSIIRSRELRQKEEEKIKARKRLTQIEEENAENLRKLQKEQKTKRKFYAFSVLVTVLLVASIFLFFGMMKSDSKAKIVTLNYLINLQQFNEADSILKNRNLISYLNIYNQDTLQKLKTFITENKPIHNKFDSLATLGETTTRLAFESFTEFDKLLPIADSLAELKKSKPEVQFEETGKQLLRLLEKADFIAAYNAYQNAIDVGIYSDKASQIVTYGQKKIMDQVPQTLTRNIDAAYVFLKAGDKSDAMVAGKNGVKLLNFAKEKNIGINDDDVTYLESLQNLLKL